VTPPPASHSRKHNARGLARRAALIDAAIEVVADHGIAGVTHRSVAARAGFPPSTTSYFFPSIDALLVEAMSERVVRQIESFKATMARIDEREFSPADLVEALVDVLVATPDAQVMAQFDLYLTAARRPDVRVRAAAMIDAFHDLAELALQRAGVEDSHHRARSLVALLDGLSVQRLARGLSDAEYERELREVLMAAFIGLSEHSPADDLPDRSDTAAAGPAARARRLAAGGDGVDLTLVNG
jgi:DNA-binding transcriptional regulator YbjK